jgi:hypothetical protein
MRGQPTDRSPGQTTVLRAHDFHAGSLSRTGFQGDRAIVDSHANPLPYKPEHATIRDEATPDVVLAGGTPSKIAPQPSTAPD